MSKCIHSDPVFFLVTDRQVATVVMETAQLVIVVYEK